jgi:transglutaminase-like putative cysteine protease
MRFSILHETHYRYGSPAAESMSELRLCPPDTKTQIIHSRELVVKPSVAVDHYTDFNGNTVEVIAIPFRHDFLRIKVRIDVATMPLDDNYPQRGWLVADARRLGRSRRIALHPFRLASALVPFPAELRTLTYPRPRDSMPLRHALLAINEWMYQTFEYKQGTTAISTPLRDIITTRAGVCQDFAHLMLAILRFHGIPARYVSGYIESADPAAPDHTLVGSEASHAWVEAAMPDGSWWGLDPTNNQPAGTRHVKIACGRDYYDVAPLRGTYQGAASQQLKVIVAVRRGSNQR